ncbi:MAG: hypothetical protein ACRC92_27335 [Peptostreptococcaceae bacterium]
MNLNSIRNPDIKLAISETLRVMNMISPPDAARIKAEMESLETEEELIDYLISIPGVYMTQFKEIKKHTLGSVVEAERIIMSEYYHVPFVMTDDKGVGVLTQKKHMAMPLYVRANQQKSFKEGKSSEDSTSRNLTGQVTGESKTGTFSDTEIVTTTLHDGVNILKECLGPQSHDLVANSELKQAIARNGEVSLADLTNESENKGSLLYMNEMLKTMGFDTDLIEPPERG